MPPSQACKAPSCFRSVGKEALAFNACQEHLMHLEASKTYTQEEAI